MDDELEVLRARCTRLRAALAGVVESAVAWVGPGGIPRKLEIKSLLGIKPGEIVSSLPFGMTLLALEVLRETAEEVKT